MSALATTALSHRELAAASRPFNPTPEDAADVLHDLGSPDITLRDVATRRGIGVPELTLWMTRPEIAAQLDAIESAVLRRARLIAANAVPFIANTLTTIIQAYVEEETHMPVRSTDRNALNYRARVRDQARKSAALLLRIAAPSRHASVATRAVPRAPEPPPHAPITPPKARAELPARASSPESAAPARRARKPLPQLTPRIPTALPITPQAAASQPEPVTLNTPTAPAHRPERERTQHTREPHTQRSPAHADSTNTS